MSVVTIGGRAVSTAGHVTTATRWHDLASWYDTWDAVDADVSGRRVARIPDRGPGGRDLITWPRDSLVMFGGDDDLYPLPGPRYLASSPRFRGRPAMRCDLYLRTDDPGGSPFLNLYAGLTPNHALHETVGPEEAASEQDIQTWFNSPEGYAQPYWLAVLGRVGSADDPDDDPDVVGGGIWDCIHGTLGTGPTVGGLLFGLGDNDWAVSNFGPAPIQITVDHPVTKNETVLVIVYANTTSSFLEVTWRDTAGNLHTLRQVGSLGAFAFLEGFVGWIHGPYLSAIGIGRGTPTTAELDRVRTYASYWIPPAGALAEES